MEGAQNAQAVLENNERPQLQLELVQALRKKLALTDALGYGGLFLGFLLFGWLSQWVPKWAFVALFLLGLLVAQLSGWDFKFPLVPRQLLGRLLVFQDRIVVEVAGRPLHYPLDATTRIQVRYQGHRDESLGGRQFADGIHNFIQLNDGPEYAFDVPDKAVEARLRMVLRSWYQRKVWLKEYRWGNRTVLLTPNLSDEQVQQYQQEFGIKLYS